MPARISVVVPVYNVAQYLAACLDSIAQQTVGDLEVVMVDDGSTDESGALAERYVASDPRFRLVRQENAGLGAARNTGVEHASGEFLAFVDSDDVLPQHAYEVMLGTLDQTGSDFVSGNVRRLTPFGTTQAPLVARACKRTRLQTHITRFPALLADRTAWNKLYRKDFWDRHGFRFPQGVLYEDIPVTLPAHYLARSVDVVEQTVYLWRRREGDDLSITQRRAETKSLRDRIAAIDAVTRFLSDHGLKASKLLYEYSAVTTDLRIFLDVLPTADEEYGRLFIDLANDFLDRADPRALDLGRPLAIDRLKWHLIRQRALPELREALRFQDEKLAETPPIRRGRHWYGNYPYQHDPRLAVPPEVYRLESDLAPICKLNHVRWDEDALRIEGYAYIDVIGAPERDSQEIELRIRPAGRWRSPLRVAADPVHRPDVTAGRAQQLASLDWSGFVARIDLDAFTLADDSSEGAWEVMAVLRAGGVTRRTRHFGTAALHVTPLAERALDDGTALQATVRATGELTVTATRKRSVVRSVLLDDGVLQLEGDAGSLAADAVLRVGQGSGVAALRYPVFIDASATPPTFLARLRLGDLVREIEAGDLAARPAQAGEAVVWELAVGAPGRVRPLVLDEALNETAATVEGRELVLQRRADGTLAVVERPFAPVIRRADWTPGGTLALAGSFRGPAGSYELLLRTHWHRTTYRIPFEYNAASGDFTAEVTPAAVASLSGARPLPEGLWKFSLVRADDERAPADVVLDRALVAALPLTSEIGGKRVQLGVSNDEFPALAVERALEPAERGGLQQRRLRTSFVQGRRRLPLRDAVLYDCFGGREYSDSPRAVHEELVRRQAPVEHLWIVRDDACPVPETAVPVRELSEAYYDAYARARFLIANDYWPRWFVRRSEQTCLQTWHGTPVKLQGSGLRHRPKAMREFRRVLRQQPENWQYVLSSGPFASSLLEEGFRIGGEILETGLPRTDLLARGDDRLAADVKRRFGVEGRRLILYAPTYRDCLDYGINRRPTRLRDLPTYQHEAYEQDGYRLGHLLDLVALRGALDEDDVVLFRKHPRVIDALTAKAQRLVYDVSEFPDEMALLLAADVLVTDYSSSVFDFAVTGRPIVFFTPDLEAYRDDVRGFSVDLEGVAPGPLLRTTDEVVEALRSADAVRAQYGERYDAFIAAYCSLADGGAAARVVDRVFSG